MSRKKWLAAASATIIMTLGVAACSPQGGDDPSTAAECGSGEPIVVNVPSPVQPSSLDPNYDTLVDFAQVSRNLFDGLFRLDDDMQIQPNLATGFEQVDDITYEVALRDDVTWHDGSAFTADDVVATFVRIASDEALASKQKSYVANVASVVATDEHTVTFTLKAADGAFIKTLATLIYIVPGGVIDELGLAEFGKSPVGTGPFRLEAWNEGYSVVLAANCDYFGGTPLPSQVEFRFISESATAVSSLQSGELDITTRVSADLARGLESNPDVKVQSIEGSLTFWLAPNTLEGPFADPLVRQALNYAVDKDTITEELLGGFAAPSGQVVSEPVLGSSDAVKPYPYDPDKTRELLKKAGYGVGEVPVELVIFREELRPAWQAIAANLEDAGFAVTTQFDPAFYADVFLAKEMRPDQILIASINNLLMDEDYALGLHLDGARRGIYFHTTATDAAIAEARAISDPEARQEAYGDLNAELYELAPVGFLWNITDIYGTSSRIDWTPRPDGAIYLAGVTKTS